MSWKRSLDAGCEKACGKPTLSSLLAPVVACPTCPLTAVSSERRPGDLLPKVLSGRPFSRLARDPAGKISGKNRFADRPHPFPRERHQGCYQTHFLGSLASHLPVFTGFNVNALLPWGQTG